MTLFMMILDNKYTMKDNTTYQQFKAKQRADYDAKLIADNVIFETKEEIMPKGNKMMIRRRVKVKE